MNAGHSVSDAACPTSPVRDVAQATRRRACLPPASPPDVPFCVAATMATVIVLAGCSAPELAWLGESRDRPPTSILRALQSGGSHSGNRSRLSSVNGHVVTF
jgi:hypothetical protein